MKYLKYFLEHLDYLLLQQIDTVSRANYFGLLFDKLPTYQEIVFGTKDITKITGINEVFTNYKLSKGHMVPRVGFEPTTLSLEVSCSIQLSYQGASSQSTSIFRNKTLFCFFASTLLFLSVFHTVEVAKPLLGLINWQQGH